MNILRRLVFYCRRVLALAVFILFGGEAAARLQGARVGSGCRIYVFSLGSEPFLIDIGNRVTVTSGVKLLTHDGATWLARDEHGRRYRFGGIRIGNEVFIGINAIVMPGVKIGDRVIVGAGSVVTRDVESGAVVVGNPARAIGTFDEYIERTLRDCVRHEDAPADGDYRAFVKWATDAGTATVGAGDA